MSTAIDFIVRQAVPGDRSQLAELVHFEANVHRHLDWRPPLDWLGESPFLVAEKGGMLLATLACPQDPQGIAWVRLFAAASVLPVSRAWTALWEAIQGWFATQDGGPVTIAAIPLQPWFETELQKTAFVRETRVVMLIRDCRVPLQASRVDLDVTIRPMLLDDFSAVSLVDCAAFVPLWQNSHCCLQMAYGQAVYATVMELHGQIIAYQISTGTSGGAHLARLAVVPEQQGHGFGQVLVYDLLREFQERGVRFVSVNTQENNASSLAVYRKMGFQPTGEAMPVYVRALSFPVSG
jgi:ribosomal-protein-alanine N-acetyltransferase